MIKFYDAELISKEDLSLLKSADECAGIYEDSDINKIKIISNLIVNVNTNRWSQILAFIATSSFVSISILFKGAISEDSRSVKKFFDSLTYKDFDCSAGKIIIKKLNLFYTLKTISSAFDDQNLLELKKAFNENE